MEPHATQPVVDMIRIGETALLVLVWVILVSMRHASRPEESGSADQQSGSQFF